MNFGKVSIIMPLYNSERYLEETLESVLNQTYKNWELIIVNDCSTDSSVEIVEKYIETEKKIKLFNLEKIPDLRLRETKLLKKHLVNILLFWIVMIYGILIN